MSKINTIWLYVWISVIAVSLGEIGLSIKFYAYTIIPAIGAFIYGLAMWVNKSGTPEQVVWPGRIGLFWNVVNIIIVNVGAIIITTYRIKKSGVETGEILNSKAIMFMSLALLFAVLSFFSFLKFENHSGGLIGD